jgi:hypothetical protein
MSQSIVRNSKNWQFSHAAAAMGAFWAGARKNEVRRIEKLRQMLVESTEAVVGTARRSSGIEASLRRSF